MVIPTLRVTEKKYYPAMVQNYFKHDVNTLRVNMTRHSLDRYAEDMEYIRTLSDGKIKFMIDLPLPGKKYRLLLDNEQELIILQGDTISFGTTFYQKADTIPVNIKSFNGVQEGSHILLGDGEISFLVCSVSEERITAVAENSATVRGQRAFCIPELLSYQSYSSSELFDYLDFVAKISPKQIVLSFAEDVATLKDVENVFHTIDPAIQIVPKIETALGVINCEIICTHFNAVMLGRGDLALFADVHDFGRLQESVYRTAKNNGTNIIAATDILSSLYTSRIPARGELTDIYYMYQMGVSDVVAAAGISCQSELFDLFCKYTTMFQ